MQRHASPAGIRGVMLLLSLLAAIPAIGGERDRVVGSRPQVLQACTRSSPSFRKGFSAGERGDLFILSFSGSYSAGENLEETAPPKKEACASLSGFEKDCCETGYLAALPRLAERIDYFPPETSDRELIRCKESHDLGASLGLKYCRLNPGGTQAVCIFPDSTPIERHGCYHLGLIRELTRCDASGVDRAKLASLLGVKTEPSPAKGDLTLPINPRSREAGEMRSAEAAE